MKKAFLLLLLIAFVLSLTGCGDTMYDMEDLLQRARKEFPVAHIENMDIQYAGMCGKDDLALIWFISGNEYQAYYYLPMEVEVVGEGVYRFSQVFKPMDRGTDIAILEWQGGYAFVINNSNCKSVRITDALGTHEEVIAKDAYPFVFYRSLRPAKYEFLDQNNNPIY